MVAPDANDLEGRLILGWVVVLAALLLAGSAGAADRIPVVASFSVIADMLAKQLEYLANAQLAGLVLGARIPIVLTSRADDPRTRMASCAIALLFARRGPKY